MVTNDNYMITNDNFSGKKGANFGHHYFCQKCDYKCIKNYDWDRHLFTRKNHNGNEMVTNDNFSGKKGANFGQINMPTNSKCECGK